MTNGMKIARQLIAEEREKQTGFLDLGMLGLTELPEELFELTELRGLNLGLAYYDKCGKRRKPPHFGSSNWLKNIPRNLGRLQGLEALYISHNPVADFRAPRKTSTRPPLIKLHRSESAPSRLR